MNRIFYFLVYLCFLATPIESLAIFKDFSVFKLVTILLFGAKLLNKGNIFKFNEPFLIIFLVYTIFTIMSSIWSIDRETTLRTSLMTVLPSFLVTLIIYYAIQDREHIEKIFLAYIVGCGIVSIIALYKFETGFRFLEGNEGRVTVLGQDQNELSFLLSFGLISIIYLLKFSIQSFNTKILILIIAPLCAFTILTTGSRTGLVLLLLIGTILTLMSIKGGRIMYIAPLIIVIGIIFLQYLPSSTTERLFQIQDQIKNRDLTGRYDIWAFGLAAFRSENAYFLGTGFDTFRSLLEMKYNWSVAPHNTYLSTFIELGIFGFVIFFSMIFYLIGKVYYLCRKVSVFYILMILPLMTAMLVLGTNNRRWLFLIGVLIIKIWQFEREEAKIEEAVVLD
jgi:O-antigen ligase